MEPRTPQQHRTVGVRELRQNASSILEELLRSGESVTITNHGRPMATLHPMTPDLQWREQLIAEGKLAPGKGSLADVVPLSPTDSTGLSDLVEEDRAERL
ncbi:type II toxin-antitoxin system Phd/YefM family antitoxin [Arthrobacter pigmenti]